MGDLLALAILAKFFFDVRPDLDATTFVVAAAALAVAAGLGGTHLLSGPLRVTAFVVWIGQELQQPNFAFLYGGLLGALVLAFLFGRLVHWWSAWAIPAAALLVLVGLTLFARTMLVNL